MRTQIKRSLSLVLALLLPVASVVPVIAATYRPGAQSGPSHSYAGGMYYSNYKRVPITGDNPTDLIAIALSQLGYQEGAASGSFSGEVSGSANYVEFSHNLGDLGLGYGGSDYPWCASFVSWCLYQSHCTDQATYKDLGRFHNGDDKYIWKEISCSQWAQQLKSAGYYHYSAYQGGNYTPRSGDLVFFRNSDGVAHIGICLYTTGDRIYTVEGNTSDSAGLEPNGGGVYFKNYSLSTSYINGYGALPYKTKSVTKIDYSGNDPTPGLYVANAAKYIYASETAGSHSWVMDRFTMFEVTQICSNGRLKVKAVERGGSTVTGYVANNSDRVIQLSATATDGRDTARRVLQSVVRDAQEIRHYNYAEETITQIRSAYKDAVALIGNTSATEAQLVAAAATLRELMGTSGSNTIAQNDQVYINGRNGVITAGDCYIYSPTWNNGLITVDNANIRYTLNVVCLWDSERQIHVVKSISQGNGSDTPAIQLGADEFLIACHDWETGIGSGGDPVEYSGTNYRILSNISVGDGVKLSGVTTLNADQDVEPAAYLKFIPKEATQVPGKNGSVSDDNAVLSAPGSLSGLVLTGDFNNRNPTPNMRVVDARKVTTTMTLEAGSYPFKVLYNGEWFGNNSTITDTTGDTPVVMDVTSGNCVIHASRTGDYVFTFDHDTMELVVAYIPDTLYLRGSFNNWGTMLPLTDNGDGTYSTTIALAAGSHAFKVANKDYTAQWPHNNYVLNLDRASTVTVTLDSRSNTLTVSSIDAEDITTFAD